jgi:hypothetical protein
VQEIADGVQGVEQKLGLGSSDIATLTSLVGQLGGIASQITNGGGPALSSLVGTAENVVELILPFIPGGSLLTAIMTAINTAMSLVGAAPSARMARRMAATPPSMTKDQAVSILRDAAAGHLPPK